MTNGVEIRIKGKVQGVGFRPFVWQLAHDMNLNGEVLNDGQGVLVRLADSDKAPIFQQRLADELPPLAQIESQQSSPFNWQQVPAGFTIVESQQTSVDTQIVPDAATCPECLQEVYQQKDHRYLYPFNNCTHCGPRFTIIKALPYDRPKTVMKDFPLCATCKDEYKNPANRRYHAQPVACHVCGPSVWLTDNRGQKVEGEWLSQLTEALSQGKIVAIKSVGGFHLACDATNPIAVAKLRDRKRRQHKPLAVMATDIECVREIADCSDNEQEMLESRVAPITLLKKKQNALLADNVAPDLNELGIMLPSNPVQHLISTYFAKPVVMTSGNGSGLPPALSNKQALSDLQEIADLFVLHNREIVQRCDDSLIRLDSNGQTETLRRSRGLVPDALNLPEGFPDADGFIAYGGDLKNAFAVGRGNQLIVSQYLGDLANMETQQQYRSTIEHFRSVYQLEFAHHIADKHPGYFSHQYAASQCDSPVYIQHHHAHVASCLVENNWSPAQGKVLALALDGLGLGDDGEFWGGELLLADYQSYQVLGGLPAITLTGGDEAAKQPWRSLFSHLNQFRQDLSIGQLEQLMPGKAVKLLATATEKQLNCHKVRSAGRLFDAVAASLGICSERVEYEGQAACRLEALAASCINLPTEPLDIALEGYQLDMASFWSQWLNVAGSEAEKAYLFHDALADALAKLVLNAQQEYQTDHLVLTGGVFHNTLLTRLVKQKLADSITILQHQKYSCGDGGLALGQLAIAVMQKQNN
ncbi:carbamoyltransferase HypF [Vibrio sp. SCSIO 43137]|uniref:carbamoyltransferase HypF n=1 Tax=Vibrio sp. SCSIO 43137 TaxID=3021011 RepID=UPI0023071E9A|nr:carbamoyltransferase HypF [Vibrio sp. SCSIO 43137]WCE29602.1 carbamoyltransferase HypF [Vibrio sp. SCSIO 43137]